MNKKLLLLALTLAWGTLWAQDVVRDSTKATIISADSIAVDDDDDEPNVIGAKPMPHKIKGEANILGAPIYYDNEGYAIGTEDTASRAVQLPHGDEVMYSVEPEEKNVFNHFFLEGECISTFRSIAVGLNFTYLPRRVGVYGSVLFGQNRKPYFSLGGALRLATPTLWLDIHLYGGATWHTSIGAEAGIRFAETARDNGRFAWRSASIGWANYSGHNYLTIGLSVELSALIGLAIWWF